MDRTWVHVSAVVWGACSLAHADASDPRFWDRPNYIDAMGNGPARAAAEEAYFKREVGSLINGARADIRAALEILHPPGELGSTISPPSSSESTLEDPSTNAYAYHAPPSTEHSQGLLSWFSWLWDGAKQVVSAIFRPAANAFASLAPGESQAATYSPETPSHASTYPEEVWSAMEEHQANASVPTSPDALARATYRNDRPLDATTAQEIQTAVADFVRQANMTTVDIIGTDTTEMNNKIPRSKVLIEFPDKTRWLLDLRWETHESGARIATIEHSELWNYQLTQEQKGIATTQATP